MVPQAVELRVLVGHACERRLETTVHEKVALLVLGTHECTGLGHLSMDSITSRLPPRPVLTVQTPTTEDTGT
jgi:hypothetical protein